MFRSLLNEWLPTAGLLLALIPFLIMPFLALAGYFEYHFANLSSSVAIVFVFSTLQVQWNAQARYTKTLVTIGAFLIAIFSVQSYRRDVSRTLPALSLHLNRYYQELARVTALASGRGKTSYIVFEPFEDPRVCSRFVLHGDCATMRNPSILQGLRSLGLISRESRVIYVQGIREENGIAFARNVVNGFEMADHAGNWPDGCVYRYNGDSLLPLTTRELRLPDSAGARVIRIPSSGC